MNTNIDLSITDRFPIPQQKKLFSIYRLSQTGQHAGFLVILAEDVADAFALAKEHDAKFGREFSYSLQEYNGLDQKGVLYDVAPLE